MGLAGCHGIGCQLKHRITVDLRDFIRSLDQAGFLVRVNDSVDWRYEIGRISNGTNRPLLFQNIKGYPNHQVFTGGLLRIPFVALALAMERMVAAGILKASPLIDTVAATSVGIVDDRALLDLAYEEDSRAEVDMNVVMTGGGHFVELQATAEGRPFTGSEMQDLLALAAAGIRRLNEAQRLVLPAKSVARGR